MANIDLSNIDWNELKSQKETLLNLNNDSDDLNITNDLSGLISFIDHVQDYAVDELGFKHEEIFGF